MRNPKHKTAKSVGIMPIEVETGTMGLVFRMADDTRIGLYLPIDEMRSMAVGVLDQLGGVAHGYAGNHELDRATEIAAYREAVNAGLRPLPAATVQAMAQCVDFEEILRQRRIELDLAGLSPVGASWRKQCLESVARLLYWSPRPWLAVVRSAVRQMLKRLAGRAAKE